MRLRLLRPAAVGATLVVARFAHRLRREQGDHKGRPYIILAAQRSELSVGLCVADAHGDLKTPSVTIALDQMGAYGVRLQLHARLLATARLPALLAWRLLVVKLLAGLCTGTLARGEVALLAGVPTEFGLTRRQHCPFRNA